MAARALLTRGRMLLTDVEWKLMTCVWERGSVGAREVCDALRAEKAWAYTTVKTMLDRLVEKGALTERKERHASVYQAAVTRAASQRAAVRGLMDRAFDGAAAPLMQFMIADEKLSKRDRAELQRMLRAASARPRGAR